TLSQGMVHCDLGPRTTLDRPRRYARLGTRPQPADRIAPAAVQPEHLAGAAPRRHGAEQQAAVIGAEVVGPLPQADGDATEVVGPDHGEQSAHAAIAPRRLLKRIVDPQRPRAAPSQG